MPDSRPSKLDLYAATHGLSGRRVIRSDADELIDDVAIAMQTIARRRIAEAGVFHLALSGGSTPQRLYQRLMIDPRYRLLPWARTHLWLVDERCVELDDDRSNFNMIRELIADHSDIPPAQVHPMPVLDAVGDQRYEEDLREALGDPVCEDRLDFILLGMGADGHTASLFPRTKALRERERWVVFNDGETVAEPRPRMTMTYPLINAARHIAALITGEAKHATLQHAALAEHDPQRFPITGVEPTYEDTELTWYLDHAAALGPRV